VVHVVFITILLVPEGIIRPVVPKLTTICPRGYHPASSAEADYYLSPRVPSAQ